jgi:hypothetical protein
MEFLKELWLFLKTRKKYWLIPLICLLALALLIVLTSTSTLAP